MHHFAQNGIAVINSARRSAFHIIRSCSVPIRADENFAKQFLARENVRLFRAGECNSTVLATTAVGLIRNCAQAKETFERRSHSELQTQNLG